MVISEYSKKEINSEIKYILKSNKRKKEYLSIMTKLKDVLYNKYKIKTFINQKENGSCILGIKKSKIFSTYIAVIMNEHKSDKPQYYYGVPGEPKKGWEETEHSFYCIRKYLSVCVDVLEKTNLKVYLGVENEEKIKSKHKERLPYY